MPSKDYKENLISKLGDHEEAAAYLTACYEDSEEVFLLGLRHVVEAYGGISLLADETKLNRESLYKMLSEKGNPQLSSLSTILQSLGLKLQFAPIDIEKDAA